MISWLVFLLALHAVHSEKMEVAYEWREIDFTFPDEADRNASIASGRFRPDNAIIIDVDMSRDGRKFVTLNSFYPGANASLATISEQQQSDGSFLLEPYPDWSWHQREGCDGIISAFRMQIDSCNRLWVIDSGIESLYENPNHMCLPQLLVFNLTTNTLIRRHRFPNNTLLVDNLLCSIELELGEDSCDDAFAYVADVYGFALHVYSLRDDRSWRVDGNLFYPYPLSGSYRIAGSEYDRMGGLIGFAVSNPRPDGDRILYFRSMSSNRESWVLTSVLKNESNFPLDNNSNIVPRQFHMVEGRRESQSVEMAMDRNGMLFFQLLSFNSVNCWNPRTPYGGNNIVELYRNDETLQFATSLKVIGDEVWVLTNRFQTIVVNTFNHSATNFRVVRGRIPELVKGTLCEPNSTEGGK